jgi:hypothetical protein
VHIANRRRDYLDKLAKDIITHYECTTLEDVSIQGMIRNQNLLKCIVDSEWGYLK